MRPWPHAGSLGVESLCKALFHHLFGFPRKTGGTEPLTTRNAEDDTRATQCHASTAIFALAC